MQWTKPDFQEITLNMEVTGYVNTDGDGTTVERVASALGEPKEGGQPASREIPA